LAHLERDLEALVTSRFAGNREFAKQVSQTLAIAKRCCEAQIARKVHRDYQAGELSKEAIASQRPVVESQLQGVLDKLATGGWPVDAQRAS
jgi:hypothetical protein